MRANGERLVLILLSGYLLVGATMFFVDLFTDDYLIKLAREYPHATLWFFAGLLPIAYFIDVLWDRRGTSKQKT